MSLQVWLPLNGNLNNQGLSEVAVINNGATVDNNGKIGSCYLVNSDKQISFSSYPWMTMKPQYNFSCFFWVKGTTDGWLIACGAWEFRFRPDFIQVHLGPYGEHAARYADAFDTDTWYHLGFTWSGTEGKLRLYLNGNLVATSDVPSSTIYDITSSFDIPYDGPRYVNDFRLYDHCLSAKEVKEISKGLVCHYKLDNNGFGGENLILESHRVTSGGDASGITSTYMDDGSLKIVSTSGNGNYRSCRFSEDSNSNVGSKLSVGDTYTISLDVKVEEGSSLPTLFINGGNSYKALHPVNGKFVTNNWFRAYYTSTWSEPGTSYGNIHLHLGFDSAIGTFYFKNFKLEKGSKPTQWCPSPLDDNTLGFDSTTEVDCSGLSNNGTKIGGLTPSTSPVSVRYESCYDFDGNTGSIQIPNLATLAPSGEFTMNCWIYHDSTWSSKAWETIFGGPSGFELEAKNYDKNSPVLYAYSWGNGTAVYELNKWNMITMTRNASETKFYINGELKITGTAGTIPSGNYFIGAWNTSSQQNYKGRISDFRLYSNVLSVEDIRELYNTSASIDKNGNMYAYEFKEV